ncbi:MAG: signal peptidase I [Alphaproteobacteria bacterium]|nr:signal peptidase I [Alphaproteobacteria bacterium]MDE2335910.1 signal peptidase I [Alphaproteobacteria bacterium]
MEQAALEEQNGKTPAAGQDARQDDDIYELFKAILAAALIALFIRSFLFEPFNIPSGSLLPTLQIGDYLFVEKYAYGYSKYSFPFGVIDFKGRVWGAEPHRGDIVVFRQPKEAGIDYIKRVIGLPGDTVQVKGGRLYINGQMVQRRFVDDEYKTDDGSSAIYKRYIETLPNGVQHYIYEISDHSYYDNTPLYKVPQGDYFMMGDNRDRSLDSRAMGHVGFVPAENLIGKAEFIFFSTRGAGDACDRTGALALVRSFACKLIAWPEAVRYGRIFKNVNNI